MLKYHLLLDFVVKISIFRAEVRLILTEDADSAAVISQMSHLFIGKKILAASRQNFKIFYVSQNYRRMSENNIHGPKIKERLESTP